MFPIWIIKDSFHEFLISSFLASLLPVRRDRRTDRNRYLRVCTLRFVSRFSLSVFLSVVSPWIPSFAQNTSSSCWSRGRDHSRAPLSEDGPRANFAAFVEWTLARNGSPFPTCSQENLASATPDPVPSPPFPRYAERMPEPTTDGEPEPAATDEPSPHGATELRIAAEPELQMTSVKVREPATTSALRENATDGVSAERSPLHRS